MTYKCLVVDDEKYGRKLIVSFLDEFQDFEVVGECNTGLEAMQFLSQNEVDLIFLDIKMPQVSGINLLRHEKNLPPTILCTAYSEYALESYDLDVVDYLLKPISLIRFARAIDKFKKLFGKHHTSPDLPKDTPIEKAIFVKSEHKLIKINISDIQHIEAMEKYVRIYTKEKSIMTLMSMMQIMEMLPEEMFMRIHRGYIIALSKIESVEGNMAIVNNKKLPISKGNRKEFKRRLML